MKLRPLRKNGIIGILTLASPLEPATAFAGVAILEKNGFEVVSPLDPATGYGTDTFGFAAGSVDARVAAFKSLCEDDTVDAIITTRGGYGTMELLPHLDFSLIKKNPKLIVGFSDVTPLLNYLAHSVGVPAIHGPALKSIAESEECLEPVLDLLATGKIGPVSGAVLCGGKAEGPLIVGNLTMLSTIVGTPWDVSYDGAMLVVEDVGEAPYRIERALQHLKLAGKLERLSGFAFGQFTNCTAKEGLTVEQVISRSISTIFSNAQYPIISGLPVGHISDNIPLPVGIRARINNGQFQVTESIF